MSAQPFRGSEMVVVEKRNGDDALDFSGPQPTHEPMTFDDVYQMYFRATTFDGPSVGWDELKAWLDQRGWTLRRCTWLHEPEWKSRARDAGWREPRQR